MVENIEPKLRPRAEYQFVRIECDSTPEAVGARVMDAHAHVRRLRLAAWTS